MAKGADVVITFDEFDTRWAEKLWRDLRTAGFEVVIANADFDALATIGSAQHLVLLWSRHAAHSERVTSQREAFFAEHGNSPDRLVIQVWLDDMELPYPDRHAVSGLRDSHAYSKGPDAVEPLVWTELVRQIARSLRSTPARVPLDWLETSTHTSSNASPRQTVVQGGARVPMSSSADSADEDYAVVIGIASYRSLNDLPSAASDARAFAAWLQASDGGAMPWSRIALRTFEVESERPATVAALVECFEPLAKQVLDHRGERLGRRLYLFASGRGTDQSLDNLVLCAPVASGTSFQGIRLKAFADWFMNCGAFQEVVLFADCRPFRTGATVIATPPPFVEVKQRFNETALLYCASRTVGGNEGSETREVGSFTQAVLERLRGEVAAVTTPNGVVTSHALVRQLSERVHQLSSGTQDAQFIAHGPEIILRAGHEESRDQETDSSVSPTESVAAHADNPALIDELGRRPFAEILAARIEEVRKSTGVGQAQESGAFMVNLHGPWGAGKTSVLNFLKANLQDRRRRRSEKWVVIEFNAWRHQRIQPPWWTLIKEIKTQAVQQLGLAKSLTLRLRWFFWRVRVDWLPSLITLVLISIAVYFMTFALIRQGAPVAGDEGVGKAVELGIGVMTALLATGAAVVALSRTLVFGSASAAQAYMDAKTDPLGPIVALFQRLIKAICRPVVVFIDDLDRCDSTYVISLLEGIQTLFRGASVTYVVAADRKWIGSCFEKKYSDFAKTLGEPGRPLGYLFLDKVFQVSASVPRVSTDLQRAYWRSLLRAGTANQPKPAEIDATRREAQARAEIEVKGVRTQEQGNRKIEAAKAEGPVAELAMRAAVAKQITSPEAMRETEHRLQPFAPLLESNPRAMKRLVNAYGLYQAAHILERRTVSQEALVRWTIVELRWPLLAEQLAQRPQILSGSGAASGLSTTLRSLLEDGEVRAVLSGSPPSGDLLDEMSLRSIVGNTEETEHRQPETGHPTVTPTDASLAT